MRRLLATLVLIASCAKPGGTDASRPPDAATPTQDPVSSSAAPHDDAFSWHSVQIGHTQVHYATLGERREGGPVLIALPPGPQTKEMVVAGLERWATSMADDGWFVVSPVSPHGTFFKESADILPEFLDAAGAAHGFEQEGLFLFGMSNGGLSAFALAIAETQRFRALVTIPGRPTEAGMSKVAALSEIPITMVVGANDDSFWTDGAETAQAALVASGAHVTLQVLPDTGHAAHLNVDWDTLRGFLDPQSEPASSVVPTGDDPT
ncbi:MAG: dienelactone hydrolase family protein [Nannocystaceae bacterium]|nr:dienelactone hydrolase family protein [Nannocystaceae bacterium]